MIREQPLATVLRGLPLRFMVLSISFVLLHKLVLQHLALGAAGSWVNLVVDLLVVYVFLQLLKWLLLVLPGQIGLWRGPSKILSDLLMLVIAAAITVVVVQKQVQINLMGVVTTSAVLTAVIGLAAQETLKDLFAGITLQLDPPFREGDWIDLGEVRGVVTELTLMNTHLSAIDGAQVVLSNSTVAQESLRRFRPGDSVGCRFTIGLDYALPPSEAIALLRRVLKLHPVVLETPPPQIWVTAYEASSISYEIMAFQDQLGERARYTLRSELLEQIWYALERAGQSVPFPVMEIKRREPGKDQNYLDFSCGGSEERMGYLRRNPLFIGLAPSQLEALAGVTRFLRYGAGEVIVQEGDQGDALFQIVHGSVEVLKDSPGGPPTLIARLGADAVFGEMTLCIGEPRSATVRASEQTVLIEVERADLMPLIDSDPGLLERIANLVNARRSELQQLADAEAARLGDSLLRRMQQLFASVGR